jgi:hypothetical protein
LGGRFALFGDGLECTGKHQLGGRADSLDPYLRSLADSRDSVVVRPEQNRVFLEVFEIPAFRADDFAVPVNGRGRSHSRECLAAFVFIDYLRFGEQLAKVGLLGLLHNFYGFLWIMIHALLVLVNNLLISKLI